MSRSGASDLVEHRAVACRLDPERALDGFDDAVAFLEDRGLLTLTPCCSLPSLFGACHEEPHSPGKPGYGQYPRTRWWWGGALAGAEGVMAAKVHRGKIVYLSARVVELISPLVRGEIPRAEAGELGDEAAGIAAHLASGSPSTTDDLKRELGLDARAFQRGRLALERRGVVVARHLVVDTEHGGHRHASELARWDQVVGKPGGPGGDDALAALLIAVVHAAVVIPVGEAQRAFTWRIPAAVVDAAVDGGHIVRLPDRRLAVPPR